MSGSFVLSIVFFGLAFWGGFSLTDATFFAQQIPLPSLPFGILTGAGCGSLAVSLFQWIRIWVERRQSTARAVREKGVARLTEILK